MTDAKHSSNFWFGFAVGTLAALGGAYLLGTAQGREKLKKILEYTEQVDANPEEIVRMIKSVFSEVAGDVQNLNQNQPSSPTQSPPANPLTSVASILEKVKGMTEETSTDKKFFK